MRGFLDALSRTKLDHVLDDARRCCSDASSEVLVLHARDDGLRDTLRLNLQQLEHFLKKEDKSQATAVAVTNRRSLMVFFVNGTTSEDGLHVHINPEVLRLLHEKRGLTAQFLVDIYGTVDWTIFPASSFHVPPNSGQLKPVIAIQYGFWIWKKNSTRNFTQLLINDDDVTYICINFSVALQDRIMGTLQSLPALAIKPLFLDVLILDEILSSYRQAVRDFRARLRAIEKEQDNTSIDDQTKTLHSLAVGWHTMMKDLEDISQHIYRLHALSSAWRPESANGNRLSEVEAEEALKVMQETCQFWSRWIRTYLERTNIRINLMHHLAAQRDNRLTQDISNLTTDIALQTQRDGVSMSTLASVTAAFLPGTFVCSVLSTVFFSYDGTSFAVSNWWWILPVMAIPLTAGVLYLWFFMYRARVRRDKTFLQTQRVVSVTDAPK